MAFSRPGSSKNSKPDRPWLPHSGSDSNIVGLSHTQHSSKHLRSSASGPGLDTYQQDGLPEVKWPTKLPPINPRGTGKDSKLPPIVPIGARVDGSPEHTSTQGSSQHIRSSSMDGSQRRRRHKSGSEVDTHWSRTSRRFSWSESLESASGRSRTSSVSSTQSYGDDSFKSSQSEENFMRRRSESHGNITELQPLYEGREGASFPRVGHTLSTNDHTQSTNDLIHSSELTADDLSHCTSIPQADHTHMVTNPTHSTNYLPDNHTYIPPDSSYEPALFPSLMSACAEENSFPINEPTQEGASFASIKGMPFPLEETSCGATLTEGDPSSTGEGRPLPAEETVEGASLSAMAGGPLEGAPSLPTEETIEGAGLYAPNINRLPDSNDQADIQQAEDMELQNFTDTVYDTMAMYSRDMLERTKAQYKKVIVKYRKQVETLQKEHESEKSHLLRQIDEEKQEGVVLRRQLEEREDLKRQVKKLESIRQEYEGKKQEVEELRKRLHESEEELQAVRSDMVQQNKKVSKLVPLSPHQDGRGQERLLSEMGERQAYLDILAPHMLDEDKVSDMTQQLRRQLKKRPFTTGTLYKKPYQEN